MRLEAWTWFVRGLGFALAVALIVGLTLLLVAAGKVVVLVIISVLLAAGLEPFIGWLRGRTGRGRSTTILVVYAAFFVLALGLAFLVIPAAINQFNELGTSLPPLLDNVRAWALDIRPAALGDSITAIVDAIDDALAPAGDAPDASEIIEVGVTVADLLISIATVLTLVFFWLTGHQRLQRFGLAFLPADRRAGARHTWNEVETRLGLWVRGQLILMGTIFAATTVAYFLMGLEGALLLGLIAGLAEAIPIVGPALGAVPALLVAALTGRIELVLLVAVVYIMIQVVEGNVLVPMVMRNTVGVPPFLVLASLVAGAAVGGIVGALLAVPLMAAAVVLLERLQARESPVLLESLASAEMPPEAPLDEPGRSLPDVRPSSGGAR